MTGWRSCSLIIGWVAGAVMIVQLVTSSFLLCAHSPANENGRCPGRKMCQGSRPPPSGDFVHSKKPSAGIGQRFQANASFKAPDVSTGALKLAQLLGGT